MASITGSSRAKGARLDRHGLPRLAVFIFCMLFAQWADSQAFTATFAIYSVAPLSIISSTSSETKSSARSTTPSSTPSTTSSSTPSSTPSTTSSSTPSRTPSNTPLNTPSTIPSKAPSNTPASIPFTTPSSHIASVSPYSSSAIIISAGTLPTVPVSSASSSKPSSFTGTGTYTSLLLPSYITSASQAPSTITPGPSGFASNSANSSSATDCGQCSVLAQQVQVFYWPTASVKTACARGSSVSPVAQAGITYAANATKTLSALGGGLGSTDVQDGFTYTFPSTYVSVLGALSVSDSCGIKGAHYTNPTPFPVAAITTASYFSWPSSCRPQGAYVEAVIDTLALSDIACPTWGVSDPFYTTCDGDVYLTATSGEPYNPVILVPTEILSIDPAWGACTNVPQTGPFVLPCGIYDPPRALHTEGSMAPTSAVAAPDSSPSAQPASTKPDFQGPRQTISPTSNSNDPQEGSPTNDPNLGDPNTSTNNGDPSSSSSNETPQQPQTVQVGQPAQGSPAADPNQGGGKSSNDPNQGSGSNHGSSSNQASADPSQASDSQPAQAPPVSNPAKAANNPAPAPVVPVAQTTLALGGGSSGGSTGGGTTEGQSSGAQSSGSQSNGGSETNEGQNNGGQANSVQANSSPGVGSVIYSAVGGGAPAPAQGGSNGGGNAQPAAAAFTPHAVTVLGQSLSITNPSAVAVAGKTLSVGGPAVTSGSTYWSLGSGGNLVAGTLTPAPAALTFAGSTYTANSASQFVIAGQTLAQGGSINVAGTAISLPSGANAAVVAGSTQALITPAPASAPAVLTFGGSTYTADSASQFIVAGQTLNPGGQITVSGTPIFEASAGAESTYAVIGGSTQSLGSAPSIANAPAVLTFDSSTYTANAASQFIIGGQTLTPGGAITVSGTPISEAAGTAPAFAVIGSSTQSLVSASAITTVAPMMTFDGLTYTADASSDFVIDGQTLTPGGQITVSGTPISEAPAGAASGFVVVGSSTEMMGTAMITPADIFTVDGQVFTANPTAFSVDGTTITAGGPGVTISGTPISLESNGVLDIGTSHINLPSESSPMTFEGAGSKIAKPSLGGLFGYLVVSAMSGVLMAVI